MDKWIVEKYLRLIGLEGLNKRNRDTWEFRCPICGDSKKSTKKRRGWLRYVENTPIIGCFNCTYRNSFKSFIKDKYNHIYLDFVKELYFGKNENHTPEIVADVPKHEISRINLPKLSELEDDHVAIRYLYTRKINKKFYDYLYYAEEFSHWVDEYFCPDKQSYVFFKDARIVIPIYSLHNKIVGVQGRALYKTELRYMTIMREEHPNICGLERINIAKPIFVTEGFFDSCFLPNSISMNSSSVDLTFLDNIAPRKNFIFIYDYEPRNKQNIKRMQRIADMGFQVMVWPSDTNQKDINNMIENGMTLNQLYDIIRKNTFKNVLAKVKIILMR